METPAGIGGQVERKVGLSVPPASSLQVCIPLMERAAHVGGPLAGTGPAGYQSLLLSLAPSGLGELKLPIIVTQSSSHSFLVSHHPL